MANEPNERIFLSLGNALSTKQRLNIPQNTRLPQHRDTPESHILRLAFIESILGTILGGEQEPLRADCS
jgi:hypothetical protein